MEHEYKTKAIIQQMTAEKQELVSQKQNVEADLKIYKQKGMDIHFLYLFVGRHSCIHSFNGRRTFQQTNLYYQKYELEVAKRCADIKKHTN